MAIYQKYIASNILTQVIAIVFIITGIVWVSQSIKMLYLFDKGVSLLGFLYITTLALPSLLFSIIPLGLSIGVVVTYNNLSHDRELIALSNSGISAFDIIKPALVISLFFTIITYSISLYFLPTSYSVLKKTLKDFHSKYASNLVQEKTFIQISKNIALYISEKDRSDVLKGAIIFEKDAGNNVSILFAKTGAIYTKNGQSYYELQNGVRHMQDNNGNIQKMSFDNIAVAINNGKLCDPSSGNCGDKNPQEYFLNELFDRNYFGNKPKLYSEGHQRIIWPLYNFVLTFLATAVFVQKPYSRRGNKAILLRIMYVISGALGVHFALYHASSKIAIVNLALYANLILCITISVYLLRRAEGMVK